MNQESLRASAVPRVSIGLPVYNGEKTLARVIESVLAQSHTDFELIISDNASSDSTEAISRQYARRDRRIRYVRQPKNYGIYWNFQYVTTVARGQYFMFQADDDYRSSENIEKNLQFLECHPEYVGSTSPNCFEGHAADSERWVTFDLSQPTYHRLKKFLAHRWELHGVLFSLFRTENLVRALSRKPEKSIFAEDWFYMLLILLDGPIKRIDDELIIVGRGGISQSPGNLSCFQYNLFDYIFPFSRYAFLSMRAVIKTNRLGLFEKIRLLYTLWKINWNFKFITG